MSTTHKLLLYTNIEAQITEAYREMAEKAKYRPAAPSDGFGNITVPEKQLNLAKESEEYTRKWWDEEESLTFFTGNCDFTTRKRTIFAIEAVRNMCAGRFGDKCALKLLKMAVAEMERVIRTPAVKEFHRIAGQ